MDATNQPPNTNQPANTNQPVQNQPPNTTAASPVNSQAPNDQPKKKKMSKVMLLIIGLAIIVVFGIIGYFVYDMYVKPIDEPLFPTPVAPSISDEVSLIIESPADETLVVEDELLVNGTTAPNATVAIYTESEELIVDADENGMFETTVILAPGINSLNIAAYAENGAEATKTLTIIYDDEQV